MINPMVHKMKLSEIARLINGTLKGVDCDISGISNLDSQTVGTVAYADNKKNLDILVKSSVSALIIPGNFECTEKPVILVDDPKLAFSKIIVYFSPYKPYPETIFPHVFIEGTVTLGKGVTILPFTSIMDEAEIGDHTVIYSQVFIGKRVKIGKNCVIKAGVKIDDETVIGDHCIIHHNTVIGGDGFGYIQKDGKNIKLPQIGNIVIENDVEIGACVTIDRAAMGSTVIGEGTKIDNLVQIAHNVKIGANSIIVAQVGIAGSTTLGRNCIISGQVGIVDHVKIGDGVVIMAQSGIEGGTIESKKVLLGSPARDFMEQKRIYASLPKLPELVKRVTQLEKEIHDKNN